jgi:hypothetical protein
MSGCLTLMQARFRSPGADAGALPLDEPGDRIDA